jgi:hypothetical protein
VNGERERPQEQPTSAKRHREAIDRITRFRGASGLALGQPCDRHGALAGEPCWERSDNSPPVCIDRIRESQRYEDGAE